VTTPLFVDTHRLCLCSGLSRLYDFNIAMLAYLSLKQARFFLVSVQR